MLGFAFFVSATDTSPRKKKDDNNQIVCDSCPLQPGGLVNSFGCDIYTKQCTCNRPKLERTYCTSNQVRGIIFYALHWNMKI